MQLVVLALLGCCVVVHSASLSDTLEVSKEDSVPESLEFQKQEDELKRDKRSGLGGSGGFLSGIGSAILGRVAEASSGSSASSGNSGRGEHNYETVEYGAPVYGHQDDQKFDIWSFKRAILNTLFQALKAIGGGVIALKGKLIQGGGVLISAKGKIVSAKGEAISGLGRNIAASAVLTPPKTTHSYVYAAPAVAHVPTGHDSYVGPPPHSSYDHHDHGYAPSAGSDSYGHGHAGYAAPSDGPHGYSGLEQIHHVDESYENQYNLNRLTRTASSNYLDKDNKAQGALDDSIGVVSLTNNADAELKSEKNDNEKESSRDSPPFVNNEEEKLKDSLMKNWQINGDYENPNFRLLFDENVGLNDGAMAAGIGGQLSKENYVPFGNSKLIFSAQSPAEVQQIPNYYARNLQRKNFNHIPIVFSYAYYPSLRSDGSVQYQPVQNTYQNYNNN